MNNYEFTFSEAVRNSGGIGLVIWSVLFLLTLAGLTLGIVSIFTALKVKGDRYPLALKLLFCAIVATLFVGAHGTITGYVDSFARLGTTTGASKASALKLAVAMANVNMRFAILAAFSQMVLAGASLWIIEKKSKTPALKELSLSTRLVQVPPSILLSVVALIPAVVGSVAALSGIESIVQLKPEDIMPYVLGLDFTLFLKICVVCCCAGIAMVAYSLVVLLVAKRKKSGSGSDEKTRNS